MRILVASKIDPDTIVALQERHDVVCAFGAPHEELLSLIPDREALVFRSGVAISREVLDTAPDLRLIVRAGSGLDNIDLAEIERRGIRLVRIPGPAAKAVSELTFAHMLALSRNVVHADRLMREEVWAKNDLESYLLTPLIQARAVSMPPAAVILNQLVVGALFGLVGLGLATPLAAAATVPLRHVFRAGEHEHDDETV